MSTSYMHDASDGTSITHAVSKHQPVTRAVSGSRSISGSVLLICPSLVISTTMRGVFVPAGNVYLSYVENIGNCVRELRLTGEWQRDV